MTTKLTQEDALAWAAQRKRADETTMIVSCPCCESIIAVYLQTSATKELVPDTMIAKQRPLPE